MESKTVDLTCGIVMPISGIDGCLAEHWIDVQNILKEAVDSIAEPKFTSRLVSDSDEVGVIQKRIVQSLYNSSIVICDVSGKNPNVMFELGLRLAFDKPTVIVKDDKTDYSFDTSVIEHLSYPRDLRFARIVEFKQRLAAKLVATHNAAASDSSHSPFLKNFGQFQVANLNQTEVSADKAILDAVLDLQRQVAMLRRRSAAVSVHRRPSHDTSMLNDILQAVLLWRESGKSAETVSPPLRAFVYDQLALRGLVPEEIEDFEEALALVLRDLNGSVNVRARQAPLKG